MCSVHLKSPAFFCLCGFGDRPEEIQLTPKAALGVKELPKLEDTASSCQEEQEETAPERYVTACEEAFVVDEAPKMQARRSLPRLLGASDSGKSCKPAPVLEPKEQDPSVATPAERRNFLKACKGNQLAAERMLGEYLAWRSSSLPLPPSAPALGRGLPDFAGLIGRDLEGSKVLLLLGAMYDDRKASADGYALALASLVDQSIDRTSDEMITVLIDTRGESGWANPRPWGIVGLVRALNRILRANFPGRFSRVIVFPVPWIAAKLWKNASPLDKDSANSIVMLEGPDRPDSPLPEGLNSYLDPDVVTAISSFRSQAKAVSMS